ncbi:MAG: hypothetical protein H8E16_07900, partial [Flavobacteriales bacterium]|nr:hypothetical protein [Flavobacteriales bacterium]
AQGAAGKQGAANTGAQGAIGVGKQGAQGSANTGAQGAQGATGGGTGPFLDQIMAHNVYIEAPASSDSWYFGGTDARPGYTGTWSQHQWVLGNIAAGSSMTATQLARHGVKVLRDGDVEPKDKLQICWSMAAELGKETTLDGFVALNLYRCYGGTGADSPQAALISGTTAFSISGSTEAVCGSFTIQPALWDACYYAVVSFRFSRVIGVNQAWFNYGIGTITDTLEVDVE